LIKSGKGFLVLKGQNTYSGNTKIAQGHLYVGQGGSLSPQTDVEVLENGVYVVASR
jgi:autotransporter-associated beta strand protein